VRQVRSSWLGVALLVVGICGLGVPSVKAGEEPPAEDLVQRARRLLDRVPLIDGHNDLPWALREQVSNQLDRIDLASDTRTREEPLHTDISRLRSGGVGGQFWSVFVPVDLEGAAAVSVLFEQIDLVHRLTQRYSETFEMAYTAADVERIHGAGKIASMIGIEGGHSINNSLALLRQSFMAGARYMTLTHWKSTDWADAATYKPEHGGLTRFGEEVVREMNRLGMLVDLSHVSAETMNDALDITAAPVIFSHSSARGLNGHSRNVPDEVLERVAHNGGVVMVTFVPVFLSEELRQYYAAAEAEKKRLEELWIGQPDPAASAYEEWKEAHSKPSVSIQDVADHIDHIRAKAGIDHIGIGSDFDGIGSTPNGLEDVSTYPALLAELLRRGYSDEDIGKIAGRNVLRVMHQAEKVAARLRSERPPSEALITDLDAPAREAAED